MWDVSIRMIFLDSKSLKQFPEISVRSRVFCQLDLASHGTDLPRRLHGIVGSFGARYRIPRRKNREIKQARQKKNKKI